MFEMTGESVQLHLGTESELTGEMVALPGSTKAQLRLSRAHRVKPVVMVVLVLLWSRDSQIWLHIRIYRGALKSMAMPRLYPKSIRLEYPAVRSHQCF